MIIRYPFVCHSSSSVISKRLYSYHPRLLHSLISSYKQSSNLVSPAIPISTLRHLHFHPNPRKPLISNPSSSLQQILKPCNAYHLPQKTLPRTLQHRRSLIIHAGSDNDSDDEEEERKKTTELATKPKDPKQNKPFYDPFNKNKPVIQEPEDPTNLQEIFYDMKEDNLIQQAVKMFDGLSQDGYTHEAMKLFGVIKDNGKMPDVVAHTAIVEAYCKAGKIKDGLKCFMRMLASGVKPNSYSYSVLIQGLCQSGMLEDAGKYTLDMLKNGWRPNAGIYVTLVDSYVRANKKTEIQQLLVKLKEKGFVADDKAARQHMKKTGRFNREVMDLLFGQFK